jgi:hypothetical protein
MLHSDDFLSLFPVMSKSLPLLKEEIFNATSRGPHPDWTRGTTIRTTKVSK